MTRALVIIISMILPLTVWSMSPIPDPILANVTGQAGVSINVDIAANIFMETTAWGDQTGLDSPWDLTNSDSGGYIGLNQLSISNLRIRSRSTDTFNGYTSSDWKPVTIDVAQDPSMYYGATFVRIGLGALEVSWDYLYAQPALGQQGYNLNQQLGEIFLGDLRLYINPASYIDIYNDRFWYGGTGITVTCFSVVDRIELSSLSWGDPDGLPAGNTGDGGVSWMNPGGSAGYIGLASLGTGMTYVIGTFAIDITSSGAGTYRDLNAGGVSVVHISFPTNFDLHTGYIIADVKLDSVCYLASPNAQTLGTIFIRDFNLSIQPNSWIDIWAH